MDADDPAVAEALTGLRELILAAEKYRQAASGYLGLDVTQAQAVSYLYSRGPLGHGELGELLGYNTSSITALVDRLERDQIARRLPHPADRRRTMVELTEHGRAAVAALRRWFAAAFDDIEPSKLPEVTAALSSVAVNLRAQAEELATLPVADFGVAPTRTARR